MFSNKAKTALKVARVNRSMAQQMNAMRMASTAINTHVS